MDSTVAQEPLIRLYTEKRGHSTAILSSYMYIDFLSIAEVDERVLLL